ncbi:MAG TPA: gamma-glutamyltransferase [Vicinamibacterales bacterium]|nr:gamma-glutamyltransferase [Vicinamibacterales bacterium]
MPVIAGRSRVATTYGIVAASQPLAARAGVQMLERGGTAVDAAIAANAVLGVTEPQSNGIGGDLFAMVYDAKSGTLHGLNASGWAPRALTPEFLASRGITTMPQSGIHSVTVPGAVAGWEALRSRLGRLPLGVLLAPAIRYAEEGFPVSDVIAAHWAALADKLAADPDAATTYLPNGRAPRAGELFRNRDLAATLGAIASDGPAVFYAGRIADAIVATARERGGVLAADDLREFAPEWVEPISTTYRGWTVYELPPNTQGIAALLMLNLMEQFPLGDYGFHSTRALHVMIEAKKLAYADMLRYVGDQRFTTTDVASLLSKDAAKTRAKAIDATRAARDVRPSTLAGLTTSVGADTVYLCAIDRDGNIASLIQSIYEGFGTAMVPRGAGFALHNRGGLFTLEPNHANTLAPRKRPLHTIIPAFMQNGDVRIGFGIMGAFNQAQAHAQFVANIVDYGLDIQQALEAGRFTKGTFAGADVNVEALVPEEVRAELAALGHEVTTIPPRTGVFGHGQAVMDDGHGVHFGASEPRHDGAAIPEAPPLP